MRSPSALRFMTLALCLATLVGCAHSDLDEIPVPKEATSPHCKLRYSSVRLNPPKSRLNMLDSLSDLAQIGCHHEVITLGEWIQKHYRNKSYSVSAEAVSVFLPEDELSEYVMESYERAYLAYLKANAYYGLGKEEAAAVELRRSYQEGKALIYNYGDDPVNMLLLATLWENLGETETSRPYWKRVDELSEASDPVGSFARARIEEIDSGKKAPGKWKVHTISSFPELDWNVTLSKSESGYYDIHPLTPLPDYCKSTTGARLPTVAWIKKIGQRYGQSYHPLLNLKSWVRLPISITYGVVTFATGATVAVGGCVVADGNQDLCNAAVKGGGYLISRSGDVTNYALKPDLRHWRRVPAAILITKQDDRIDEPCFANLGLKEKLTSVELGSNAESAKAETLKTAR